MIFTGQIQPGELLPSRKELAARFGVGISTIHEAITSLATVGLVRSRPGKGTWVRQDALDSVIHPSTITNRFGQIDVETIYEARLVMEVALAELAARKATPEDIKEIWAALEAQKDAIRNDEEFVKADWDFHLAVAKAGHNVLLQTFYHLSRELLLDFIKDAIRLPNVKEEASQYHILQAEAIEQRDVEKARQAALDHMLYVKERITGT
jgi:GntR family transcriptional repressor for pyruvate dehydrogenase complex